MHGVMDGPETASGILGSTLLSALKTKTKNGPLSLSSGCAGLDEGALDGGFRYGEIVAMAGPSGTGKTTIAFHAIASHLLQDNPSNVAIIDTKGSFSPQHLRDILSFRLRHEHYQKSHRQTGYMYEQRGPASDLSQGEALARATSLLDRVKVMRVFDLAGLVEAVSEVGEMCEGPIGALRSIDGSREEQKRTSVADSEDEADECSHSDDGDVPGSQLRPEDVLGHFPSAQGTRFGMISIDAIANVVGPEISRNQVQGQAVLTGLMRSLHHMTLRYQICTILINSLVGAHASSDRQQRRVEEDVSIFSSIVGKPALGRTFAHSVDTSLLLSTLPATRRDAELASDTEQAGTKFSSAGVLEVLKDRHASKAEGWAAFRIQNGTEILSIQMKSK